ncbi:uncharacterized protein LOC100904841 [Galendromus occidentalis]|uniref:Uncharacterized protein LOC100904841 n=1 Tax=Galendromus occidentalis TaxID=34638 RepID=A0AAJ6QPD4_9ACAR|nr:uncharacterized protein LOC100904841 [Galendromus occidentalis]
MRFVGDRRSELLGYNQNESESASEHQTFCNLPRISIRDACCEMGTWSDLREGRFLDGDCQSDPIAPKWLVQRKYKRGQQLLNENVFAVMFCHLGGLVMLVNISSIYYPLEKTGNSTTLVSAFQRYLHTLTHVLSWYETDVFEESSEGFKSLKHVRRLHRKAASMMTLHRAPLREGEKWISQYDMALTQFAFIGMMIIHPEVLGFSHLSEEDRLAICHFWRCIGHLLGISDQYNLFDSEDLHVIEKICRSIEAEVFIPSLTANWREGHRMGKTIMESSTKNIIHFMTYNGIMKYWSEVVAIRFMVPMTCTDWFYFYLIKATLKTRLLGIQCIRRSFNQLLHHAIGKAPKRATSVYKTLCIRDNQGGVQIKGCPFAAAIC